MRKQELRRGHDSRGRTLAVLQSSSARDNWRYYENVVGLQGNIAREVGNLMKSGHSWDYRIKEISKKISSYSLAVKNNEAGQRESIRREIDELFDCLTINIYNNSKLIKNKGEKYFEEIKNSLNELDCSLGLFDQTRASELENSCDLFDSAPKSSHNEKSYEIQDLDIICAIAHGENRQPLPRPEKLHYIDEVIVAALGYSHPDSGRLEPTRFVKERNIREMKEKVARSAKLIEETPWNIGAGIYNFVKKTFKKDSVKRFAQRSLATIVAAGSFSVLGSFAAPSKSQAVDRGSLIDTAQKEDSQIFKNQ